MENKEFVERLFGKKNSKIGEAFIYFFLGEEEANGFRMIENEDGDSYFVGFTNKEGKVRYLDIVYGEGEWDPGRYVRHITPIYERESRYLIRFCPHLDNPMDDPSFYGRDQSTPSPLDERFVGGPIEIGAIQLDFFLSFFWF